MNLHFCSMIQEQNSVKNENQELKERLKQNEVKGDKSRNLDSLLGDIDNLAVKNIANQGIKPRILGVNDNNSQKDNKENVVVCNINSNNNGKTKNYNFLSPNYVNSQQKTKQNNALWNGYSPNNQHSSNTPIPKSYTSNSQSPNEVSQTINTIEMRTPRRDDFISKHHTLNSIMKETNR